MPPLPASHTSKGPQSQCLRGRGISKATASPPSGSLGPIRTATWHLSESPSGGGAGRGGGQGKGRREGPAMQPETWPSGEHALKWKLKDGNSDYSKMYDNGATKYIIMLIRFIAEKTVEVLTVRGCCIMKTAMVKASAKRFGKNRHGDNEFFMIRISC